MQAIEFVVKNGSPQAVMALKRDSYKISSLCSFSYMENGKDVGRAIREKTALVCDLL